MKGMIKKGLAILLSVMMLVLCGCQQDNGEVEGYGEELGGDTYSFTEAINGSKYNVWYLLNDASVGRESEVEEILIFKKGELAYRFYPDNFSEAEQRQLAHFAGMDDKELIEYIESFGFFKTWGTLNDCVIHVESDQTGNYTYQEIITMNPSKYSIYLTGTYDYYAHQVYDYYYNGFCAEYNGDSYCFVTMCDSTDSFYLDPIDTKGVEVDVDEEEVRERFN